jgi:FKBP-type peptidyl-prolyl cis-trans isomerase FkpA
MQPGGKRTILIPAALAYGANPPGGSGIPANADLIFDIELISIQ